MEKTKKTKVKKVKLVLAQVLVPVELDRWIRQSAKRAKLPKSHWLRLLLEAHKEVDELPL